MNDLFQELPNINIELKFNYEDLLNMNNKILLTLSLLLVIINPFTFEGFILELVMCGIFYKQYREYCKICKPKSVKYGLTNLR